MSIEEAPVLADVDVVQQCLEGNEEAISGLKRGLTPFLSKVLASYGASKDEIDEIVAQLWADCLTGPRPLFHVFNGKSALKSWLTAISVNRWISLKRRETQHARAMERLAARKSKVQPSQVCRKKPHSRPRPGARYGRHAYARAIARAGARAGSAESGRPRTAADSSSLKV